SISTLARSFPSMRLRSSWPGCTGLTAPSGIPSSFTSFSTSRASFSWRRRPDVTADVRAASPAWNGPWGWRSVIAGVGLGLLAYAIPFALIFAIAHLLGHSSQFNYSGDAFHKAADVARYADQRLA